VENSMLGLLVVTHGRFAEELVNAAETIVGKLEAFEALSIGWNDQMDLASKELTEALKRVNRGHGVIVLTDMFGGTPTNLALSQMDTGKVEIVTGVNLSMLIKFTSLRERLPLAEAAQAIAEEGRQAIQVASQLLDEREEEHPEGVGT
jgi:PTS system mannose-specific IIA component